MFLAVGFCQVKNSTYRIELNPSHSMSTSASSSAILLSSEHFSLNFQFSNGTCNEKKEILSLCSFASLTFRVTLGHDIMLDWANEDSYR
jgi:hypothetical protein